MTWKCTNLDEKGSHGFSWEISVTKLLYPTCVDCIPASLWKSEFATFDFSIYIPTNFSMANYSCFCGTHINSVYLHWCPLNIDSILIFCNYWWYICVSYVTRNQTIIGKICLTISNTHETLGRNLFWWWWWWWLYSHIQSILHKSLVYCNVW